MQKINGNILRLPEARTTFPCVVEKQKQKNCINETAMPVANDECVYECYWCHHIGETRLLFVKINDEMYDTIARTQPYKAEMLV